MNNVPIDLFEYDLSKKQRKQAQILKDAYKRIVLWKNKDKLRLLNPTEIEVFEYK